uniref:Fatty acyl-CoA reductase C-terminal domain-containing protein n=1 Tax=Timema shepardi TaxID=629360 RepID=A0A7R9ARQ2_TIMSH|nr:unnamed protein product [Timema shepardi]
MSLHLINNLCNFFRLFKVYRKIHRLSGILTYFCTRNWDFSDDNVQKLWKNLGPEDKKLFDFDISSLDWNQYIYNYVRGCRVHLLKDDLSTVPEAKIRWQSYNVKFESNLNISLRLHIFHSFHIQALLKARKIQNNYSTSPNCNMQLVIMLSTFIVALRSVTTKLYLEEYRSESAFEIGSHNACKHFVAKLYWLHQTVKIVLTVAAFRILWFIFMFILRFLKNKFTFIFDFNSLLY